MRERKSVHTRAYMRAGVGEGQTERERERERENESQAGSITSTEPNARLDLTTVRS